jgi:hypothetical protein
MGIAVDSSSARRSWRGVPTMALVGAVVVWQTISTSTNLPARTTAIRNGRRIMTDVVSNSREEDNEAIETSPYLSACVYYMDDNHRLAEWLAYPHYTMNLRHVIMSIDYKSLTDPPQDIFDRWVSKGLLEIGDCRDLASTRLHET